LILDALTWWRSFWPSARVVGNVLLEYMIHSVVLYSFFRWLFHIATLGGAWVVITILKICWIIRWPYASFWCRGRVSHFKKKSNIYDMKIYSITILVL
jgi:hypothetical protein